LTGVTRNNLNQLDVAFPLGVFTTVTGVSGSGKSSLVSQALVELVGEHLGHARSRR
jgi:excinuclease ABC subunit A